MCNQYANRTAAAEVARLFDVPAAGVASFNATEDIFPGYPGMVVRIEPEGRYLSSMIWGFPRHEKSKRTGQPLKPRPVNNARDDRLLHPFWPWKDSFEKRRCIIPLTAWAEPQGPKGRMTCTWYSLPDTELFAVAGIWTPTDEWGDAYSMVMVDGCKQMAEVHDRMPIILHPDQYEHWTLGTPDEAMALVKTYESALVCDQSSQKWGTVRPASVTGPLI